METLEDYNFAIKKFCEDNSKSSIYLVGEISHPGVSDLDFLIVDDEPVVSDIVKPYLMGGNVLIMPEFAMHNIQTLENFDLQLIHGHGHTFSGKQDYNENEKIIEILEWLPERILKCRSFLKENNSKRDTLLLHKSINRSILGVSALIGKKYSQVSVTEARQNFELSADFILSRSIKAGEEAWQDFEDFLQQTKLKGTATGNVKVSKHYSFENTFNHLLLYFYRACMIDCRLSKKLSERLSINTDLIHVDDGLNEHIVRRWELIDKIYVWFLEKKLNAGMIKYGWLL